MTRGAATVRRARPWLPWGVVALSAGIAAVAGSYLAVGRRPAFVATPVDEFVLAASPDALVSFAITTLGTWGHVLAFLTAIALAALVLGVATLPGVLALRDGRSAVGVVVGAALPGAVAAGLSLSPASSAGAAVGAGLVVLVAGVSTWVAGARETSEGADGRSETSPARRRVLGALGAALGLGGLGLLTRGTGTEPSPSGIDVPEDARPEVRDLLGQARDRSLAVEGLEPLVSTDFYEVDINSLANPDVDRNEWTLSVTGEVETEVEYDFADVEAMAFEDRFVTLRCVGDVLNGRQMDTALWGGVPAAAVLEEANPLGDRVVLTGTDGFYNEFALADLEEALLAYRMNGRPLPRGHGSPLRALVPGHWGEICVKWLTEIEVQSEDTRGYWEYRGWDGTGEVHTVAKLWQVNHPRRGRVEVAGHAYAGTRGISAVEVSVDGGETWEEAELSEPLPGDDVWRQWRLEYAAVEEHEVVVRARDGEGSLQIPEQDGPRPTGATGWVSRVVRPT